MAFASEHVVQMRPVQACLSRKSTLAASHFRTRTQAFNHVFVVKQNELIGTSALAPLLSAHSFDP
jgi:hypothetical protein